MTNVSTIVKRHLRASKRLMKSVTASPRKSRGFLVRAGVLEKSGKKLAKPCA